MINLTTEEKKSLQNVIRFAIDGDHVDEEKEALILEGIFDKVENDGYGGCDAINKTCEVCPHCMTENEIETKPGNYISSCKECSKKLLLCSDCYHDGNGKCDWNQNGCYRERAQRSDN